MAFEDVPAGQELHCRCETLINYEEMKGASLGSFESVELILVLTHRLANSGGFCQFSNRVAVGRFQSLTLEPAIINSFSSPRKLPTLRPPAGSRSCPPLPELALHTPPVRVRSRGESGCQISLESS